MGGENDNDYDNSDINSIFVDALGDVGREPEATDPSPPAPESVPDPEVVEPADPPADDIPDTDVEPDPEAPAADPDPQPSDTLNELLNKATELGISTAGMTSEQELAEAILEQIRVMQPEVRYAQSVRAQLAQRAQQQPVEQQPPSDAWDTNKYFEEKWGGPVWKPEYTAAAERGLVTRNEDGNWTPTPGNEIAAGALAGEMNAATLHRQQFWENLGNGNFYQSTWGVLEKPIEQKIEEMVQQMLESREYSNRQASAVERFEQENAHWLFQRDPSTGEMVPSELGSQLIGRVRRLQQRGIGSAEEALEEALIGFPVPENPQNPAPNPPNPVANANPSANNQPNEPPENSGGGVQKTKQETFLDRARRVQSHSASTRGADSEEAPQVQTEGDLNTFFERAYRKSRSKAG